jgi:hypothetical protein
MKLSVRAIRDSDALVLGEVFFDITDKVGRNLAVSDLLDKIYGNATDPLCVQPFTFKFDVPRNKFDVPPPYAAGSDASRQ